MSKVNYKKLGNDTIAFGFSNIASKVISYFLLPLYTSVLSTEEFGFADTLLTFVNLLYPILTLSISEALLRFTIDEDDTAKRNEYITVTFGIVALSTLVLWSIKGIAGLYNSMLKDYWIYVVLLYLGFNIEKCTTYYTKAIGKTRLVAVSGVFNTVLLISSNLLLLLVFKIGMMGYIFSMILSYYGTAFFEIVVGRLWKNVRLCKFKKQTVVSMLSYSTPMIVTIIAWWINTTADKYIIELSLGIGARGLYAAAYKIPTIISSITGIFIDAWKLTIYGSSKDEIDGSFYDVYKNLGMFCTLVVMGLITLSEIAGKIMFSSAYFSAWRSIPFLAGAVYFSTLSGYLASAITKSKNTSKLLFGTLSGAIVNILLGIILVPRYGIVFAALTTYVGFFLTWIIRVFQIKKFIAFKINVLRESISIICITAACVLMSFGYTHKYYAVVPVLIISVVNNFSFIKNAAEKIFSLKFSVLNKK